MLAAEGSQRVIKYGLNSVPQYSYSFHNPPLFIQELVIFPCQCQRFNCARAAKTAATFLSNTTIPLAFFQ